MTGRAEAVASRTFAAIGTRCQVLAHPEVVDAATRLAARQLAELDRACSRFRSDSELNRLRRGSWQPISPLLTDVLAASIRTARRTDGLVDPTVGTALAALGYDDDLDRVRGRTTDTGDHDHQPAPGHWRVMLDQATRRVLVPTNVDLDLGASAKAWAADRAAQTCAARLPGPFLVNFGGDIAVSGLAPARGWQIGIDDGEGPQPVVAVQRGGMATSSTAVRTWRQGGQERHHIVDPRTGDSAARVWRTVTVVAETCELANAAATAAVVLGVDGPQWLARRGLPARLVSTSGVPVFVGDWPEDRPQPGRRSA